MTPAVSQPRPLPIRPRPMTGESPGSYLRRLARANHLRPAYLRRYLRQPDTDTGIRLDWLASLAGRTLPDLERALAIGHVPARTSRHVRQAEKPGLFAAIRRDARHTRLSIRALADQHGVHRRTVRQALDSPWPTPRKTCKRRSKLDPFKETIDGILLAEQVTDGKSRHTATQIFHQLVTGHNMTGICYTTVNSYITSRRPELHSSITS